MTASGRKLSNPGCLLSLFMRTGFDFSPGCCTNLIQYDALLRHPEVRKMKQITIRDIPEIVKKAVKKEAASKGLSLNRAVLLLLDRAVTGGSGDRKRKALHHDLDHLSGIWTQNESAAFDKHLTAQRETDEKLWKQPE
jgi:hypothetical protein